MKSVKLLMEENRLKTHTKCLSIGLKGNNRVKDREEGRGERDLP